MAEKKTTTETKQKPAMVEYTVNFLNGDKRVCRAEKGSIFGNRIIVLPAGDGYPETAYPIYTVKSIEVRNIL